MSKFDWKKTLGTVAPAIATALGGPLAGVAVSVATKALGIEGNEDALVSAIASGDPNILVKLKEADNNFKVELKRLDITLAELEVKDRNSARVMAQTNGQQVQMILGSIYTGGFVWLLFSLFTGEVNLNERHEGITNVLLGMLSAGQAQVLNFFFGSSSGSKAKSDALAGKL